MATVGTVHSSPTLCSRTWITRGTTRGRVGATATADGTHRDSVSVIYIFAVKIHYHLPLIKSSVQAEASCDDDHRLLYTPCCVPRTVNCGAVRRDTCGQCAYGAPFSTASKKFTGYKGRDNCRGDCKWDDGEARIVNQASNN